MEFSTSGALTAKVTEVKEQKCGPAKKSHPSSGHWKQEEHLSYLQFFKDNHHFSKGERLFKRLSQTIGTRTPSQCRSHHQKFNPNKKRSIKKFEWVRTKTYVRALFYKNKTQQSS